MFARWTRVNTGSARSDQGAAFVACHIVADRRLDLAAPSGHGSSMAPAIVLLVLTVGAGDTTLDLDVRRVNLLERPFAAPSPGPGDLLRRPPATDEEPADRSEQPPSTMPPAGPTAKPPSLRQPP